MKRLWHWLRETWLDYSAWRKHQEGEEMDFMTLGKHGYWRQEPHWPRKKS